MQNIVLNDNAYKVSDLRICTQMLSIKAILHDTNNFFIFFP